MRLLIGVFCFLVFLCCTTDKDRYIGKLKVMGIEGVYFNIYQKDEWDWATPLYFETVDENDVIITPRRFLIGTLDVPIEDVEGFYSGSCGSIIYLAYADSTSVDAIVNLSTKKAYGNSNYNIKLFQILKSCNPTLHIP